VQLNSPERNYHIFYQLCYGASAEEKKRWRLKPAQEFHYLRQSTCFELPGVRAWCSTAGAAGAAVQLRRSRSCAHTAHRTPHTAHRTPHTAHRAPHTGPQRPHRTPHHTAVVEHHAALAERSGPCATRASH
jgi:hypothetical protein